MTFELAIPTRWPDFDALGHLNQAVYHVFLDEARDDALRQTVGDFDTWPNVVVHTSIDYRHEIVRGVREVVVTTARSRPRRRRCLSRGIPKRAGRGRSHRRSGSA